MPDKELESQKPVIKYVVLFVCEFFGTAFMVYMSCLSLEMGRFYDSKTDLKVSYLIYAFCYGLSILAIYETFGHISGAHVNPALSLAYLVWGKLKWNYCILFVFAQYLGAFAGYGIVYFTLRNHGSYEEHTLFRTIGGYSILQPFPLYEDYKIFLVELIGTFILVMGLMGLLDNSTQQARSGIALTQCFIYMGAAIALGPLTGAALNPARVLPPAVIKGYYKHLWAYKSGPILGGLLAGVTYRFCFDSQEKYCLRNAF